MRQLFCVLTDGNHLKMNSEKVSSNLQKFQQLWTMALIKGWDVKTAKFRTKWTSSFQTENE